MAESTRCAKCVLPASTPNIEFDSNGVCNVCARHRPMQVQGEQPFRDILDQYRDPAKKYDCMVGISGGRDSTYLLYNLVKKFKLRVLAVHYNNPFNSAQATRNLDSAVEQLGVDCIRWTYKPEFHVKETRKALKIWSKKPSHSMLPMVCAVCKGWWPHFFRIARENDISLVVIGSNPLESASFKEGSFGGARTYHKLSRMPKTLLKGMGELAGNPGYLTCSWPAVTKAFLMASHDSPYVHWKYPDVRVVRLFDYLKWDEQEVMETISRELGWQKDPEHDSPWRFDCRLDHIKKFLYSKTIGVSELEDLFSKMIREGMMTRERALERLVTENAVPLPLVEDILGRMDLKLEDLDWPAEWKFTER